MVIRDLRPGDYPQVRAIHQQGIDSGNASFLSRAPDWAAFDQGKLPVCRRVAEARKRIIGWAALAPLSSQCFFSGVAELSLYVATDSRNQGVGSALMTDLIDCSERQGLWTLQALIFPENTASIALHLRHGFRTVGTWQRPARMPDGRWRDVQVLERRSRVVGVE